jgi:hypothetical protein
MDGGIAYSSAADGWRRLNMIMDQECVGVVRHFY